MTDTPFDYEDLMLKRCAKCGAWTKTRYCFDCKPTVNRARHAKYDEARKEAESRKFYNSRFWRGLAAQQKRLFPYCQWKHPDGDLCRAVDRLAADHIIPREKGGEDALHNLQSLCFSHHAIKTGQETGGFLGRPLVTVVCGPPGAGKTTYVTSRAKPLDLIIDLDRILGALALSEEHLKPGYLLRCAWEARDAIHAYLLKCRDVPRAWIVEGAPTPERRASLRDRFRADVILLLPTREQCKERVRKDENRDQTGDWDKWIDDWFDKYSPSGLDIVIS
jgi:hypothetical protein